MPRDSSGPHLIAAILCGTILQEANGLVSAIRLIDQVTLSLVRLANAEEPLRPLVELNALIVFNSGGFQGDRTLVLEIESPTGHIYPSPATLVIPFQGGERGVNIVTALRFIAESEGLYWINVLLDQDQFTRVPIRIDWEVPGSDSPETALGR